MHTTRTPNLQQQRQRLETLVQPTPGDRSIRYSLRQILTTLGDRTMKFLTGQNELRIWQRTRSGQPLWFAHDPVTNRTRSFCSEQDVRNWLDSRYYE
ncbi:MAG: hypothetical protein WBG38_01190 [Nodosilinea sp.]